MSYPRPTFEPPDNVRLFQSELAFELPDGIADEQLCRLYDMLATQYADVSTVRTGICNPPLILLKFPDLPTEDQVLTMRRQIAALMNHL